MNDFYLTSISEKKKRYQWLFEETILEVFAKEMVWEEFVVQEEELLRKVLIQLNKKIDLKESSINVQKLSFAIQNARSGAGFAAITSFRCHFCDKDELWSNTSVPNICSVCAKWMAENIAIYFSDIWKDQNKQKEGREDMLTIEELDFSVRTYNILKRAGINTLEQLSEKTEEELLTLKHFSTRTLREIKDILSKHL